MAAGVPDTWNDPLRCSWEHSWHYPAILGRAGFHRGTQPRLCVCPANGSPERLPQLADMLARQKVDLIISVGTLATRAAMAAAPGTPIVLSFAGEDPVEAGLARSLASFRP